tara:strand:- start:260 stop:394 length:135 start_codon:yes stop_codon:yes gene_type:complete
LEAIIYFILEELDVFYYYGNKKTRNKPLRDPTENNLKIYLFKCG